VAENFDPVLGGQGPGGFDPVMGGLVGIEQALGSPNPKVRIQAIKRALQYGAKGADLVIQAMQKDPNQEVRLAAWKTLLESRDPQLVQVAKAYQPSGHEVEDVWARYATRERDFRRPGLREASLVWEDSPSWGVALGFGNILGLEANLSLGAKPSLRASLSLFGVWA